MGLPAQLRAPMVVQTAHLALDPEGFFARTRRRHGDVFTMRVVGEPWVVLGNPEAVRQVFSHGPDELNSGEPNQPLRPVLGTRNLLLLDGQEHLQRRRMVLPSFHGERMRTYEATIREAIARELERWPLGEPVAVLPRMQALTFSVILRCVLGVAEGDQPQGLTRALREMLAWVTDMRRVLVFYMLGPERLMSLRAFREQMERVDRELRAEIERRRGAADLAEREDILSLLIAARDEEGRGLSDGELRDELVTLLIAGHETTATLIAWAMHELARAPAAQERLAAEGRAYADAVITETLRLRPPVYMVARRLRVPLEIAGCRMPAGTNVAPCSLLVHRDPGLYPDPLRFEPERFLERRPPASEWFPFGGGVRRCVGASFAQFEAGIVLEELARELRFEPPAPRPERVTRRAIVLVPARGARVVAMKRSAPAEGRLPPGSRMPSLLQGVGFWARPSASLERGRRRFGRRFTVRLPGQPPFVVLSDPEEIKQVFQAPPEVLHPGEGAKVLEPLLGPYSVILLDEERHLEQRKLLLPAFHGERMQRLTGLMEELAGREVASWPAGEPLELHSRLQRLTLEIILRAVFGLERGARLDSLRRLLTDVLTFTESPLSLFPVPEVFALAGPLARLRAKAQRADELIFQLIEERRAQGEGAGAGDDVLALLLAARHEDGSPMEAQELRDELMTALVAGHETTASQLAWGFAELARHPAAAERLAAEIEAGAEEEYLTATINEILRRRPVLPNAEPRLVKQPIEIGGWTYPAGVVLTANAYLVHHDPEIYPEPYAFRPERFLERAPGTYTWIPFGGGRRRCLGASFALLEMKVVLRAALARWQLSGAGPPERARRRSITMSPGRGGEVVLRERVSPGALNGRQDRAESAPGDVSPVSARS